MIPRLKDEYEKKTIDDLQKKFSMKNKYMVPKFIKVVLNMGLGLDATDSKILKSCEEDMAKITGQKPVTTKFKKSVANFKTRKGSNAGLKVALRKKQWELALSGDTKMLIWLGKQHLGQKDNPSTPMNNPISSIHFVDDNGDIVL